MKRIFDLTENKTKKFITADWHLGDPRMEILGRPFSNASACIKTLIKLHNSIVSPEDEVIIIGDVCYKERPEAIKYLKFFNGRKVLIRGNHDNVFSDNDLEDYFEDIIPDGQGLKFKIDDIPCYAVHYPTQGKKDMFTLCGHIHAAWRYQLNSFNVGIDANHFRPINLATIPTHLKAITDFYDDDVWVAYNDINASYVGKRGKKGSYYG